MKANNRAEMSETNEYKFVMLNETALNCSHKMARTVLCGSLTWYIPLWGAITLMFTLLDLDYKPSLFFSPLPTRDRCNSFSFSTASAHGENRTYIHIFSAHLERGLLEDTSVHLAQFLSWEVELVPGCSNLILIQPCY